MRVLITYGTKLGGTEGIAQIVADHHRMRLIPERSRAVYASACAGAIAQNVYLYCASAGLASVVRGLFDEAALGNTLGLAEHQKVVLTQTVGSPRS